MEDFLAEVQDVPREVFSPHLYRLVDREAVEHLYRVASGLDSLVLGEPQILGQVMAAFELARGQDAVGPVLSRLFQSALHTGKRARAETAISHNPASISSVAINLAEQSVPNLPDAQIVVVGAGEMAELAVAALKKRGAHRILVVNRTLERARNLAEQWGGESATFEKIPQAIARADIVIASTGAPHMILYEDMVKTALSSRPDRPLVIIDIAVPRDVDPEVGDLFGVQLYDIDMLHDYLENSLARRASQVPLVERILDEELREFMRYFRSLDVIPLIVEMWQRAEAIREAELEKTLRRMPNLTPGERKRLEAMTMALVKKLLHAPTTRLRAEAGTPRAADIAEATRNLFGLEAEADTTFEEYTRGSV